MLRIVLKTAAVVAMAASAVLVSAASADAADEAPEQHCVYHVQGVQEDLQLEMGAVQCFETFSQAAAALSRGQLQLPYETPVRVLIDAPRYVTLAGSFTIGIHYDYYNGGGSSISVTGSSFIGGWWNTPGWFDNRESSSYNGCNRLRHYDGPNRGGTYQDTWGVGQTDNLTSVNNDVESVSYHS